MNDMTRRVAIIGGSRIPFCGSNTFYADSSNMDMLTAAIDALVQRFSLEAAQPDEVSCGPTCLHSVYRFYGDELPLAQGIEFDV